MLDLGVPSEVVPPEPIVWSLHFIIEDDEARLRFQHIWESFKGDANVSEVELSHNADEALHILIVKFKPGKNQPDNRDLHHYGVIHGEAPIQRSSRYERLLGHKDIFES